MVTDNKAKEGERGTDYGWNLKYVCEMTSTKGPQVIMLYCERDFRYPVPLIQTMIL